MVPACHPAEVKMRVLGPAHVLIAVLCARVWAVEPVAVLMAHQGPVEVHRPQSGVLPGAFGLHLGDGDEIVTGPDGVADVLFASGQSIHLGPKSRITIQGSPVSASGGDSSFESVQRFAQLRESRGTSSLARLRSGGKADALRCLAPSSARVRGTQPQFRWTGGDPAMELVLTVYDAEKSVWSGRVTGTSLEYPADAPALASGVRYSWAVASDDPLQIPPLRSSAAYFECMDAASAAAVEAELSALAKSEMSEQGRALAKASVLYGHGLLDEAIAHTEQVISTNASAELQTILAQLYVEAGRIEDALIQMDRLAHPQ
jgi:hypothetical protein